LPIARWKGAGQEGFIAFNGTLLARFPDSSLKAIDVPGLKSIAEK